MAAVKSYFVNSREVNNKCELCEKRGGCRRGKGVTMTEGGQNEQLERLIQAMNANTRSLLGQPPDTQAQREVRERESLMKEEQSEKLIIESENVKEEISEFIIFEEFAKIKLKLQELTEEHCNISDTFFEVMENQAKMQAILKRL